VRNPTPHAGPPNKKNPPVNDLNAGCTLVRIRGTRIDTPTSP
jgi:hypothetical protein